MTPVQRYTLDLKSGDIFPDIKQAEAVSELQHVYEQLLLRWESKDGLWQALMKVLSKPKSNIDLGLYFWGGVGRGKTYLMDLFYHCLPGDRKMRMHFHRFMQMVHRGLHEERGNKDPLARVAEKIVKQVDVICFDEFFVSDIGDAMILGTLFEVLLSEGVILIATSNLKPDSLYLNGLQRERFLPAIALIKLHTKVVNMDGGVDYRLRKLEQAAIFYTPLNEATEKALQNCFVELSHGFDVQEAYALEILGRDVQTLYYSDGLVYFSFEALCLGPRSAADYIEIAQLFNTLILSDVPVMDERGETEARRFISLIDELYDHKVKLIMSAAAPLKELYQGSELHFPFERTYSRLLEMQSHEYLALEHNP